MAILVLNYKFSSIVCHPKQLHENNRRRRDGPPLDLLNPEYNILKIAGSSFGLKHSSETIAKLKNHILTEEQKAKHLEHLNRMHANLEFKANQLDRWKRLNADPEYQAKRLAAL